MHESDDAGPCVECGAGAGEPCAQDCPCRRKLT